MDLQESVVTTYCSFKSMTIHHMYIYIYTYIHTHNNPDKDRKGKPHQNGDRFQTAILFGDYTHAQSHPGPQDPQDRP